MTSRDGTHEDLAAAIATRKELGKDYEPELVESFLDKLDASIAARVDDRVAARLSSAPAAATTKEKKSGGVDNAMVLGLASLGIAIPLSGIAGGTSGVGGLVVAWLGIVGVNVAHALSRRS